MQGLAHHAVRNACPADAYTPVCYETLCTDPVDTVRHLCRAARLVWDESMPAAIRSHSMTSSSTAHATAWHDAPPEHIQAVRAGYMATEPVLYADEWEG